MRFRQYLTFVPLLFLGFFLTIAVQNSYAVNEAVHAASVHSPKKIKLTEHLKKNPWLLSLEVFTVNPKLTSGKLKLGPLIRLNYIFNPNFYIRLAASSRGSGMYSYRYLMGITSPYGHIHPYAEAAYVLVSHPSEPLHSNLFLDVGFVFAFWRDILPLLEFDNYQDSKKFAVSPQVIIPITRSVSLLLGYVYILHDGRNRAFLRLNINF